MSDETLGLKGLSRLLNTQNIKPDIDLDNIEKNISSSNFNIQSDEPTEKFDSELNQYAEKLGISFGDLNEKPKSGGDNFNLPQVNEVDNSSTIAPPKSSLGNSYGFLNELQNYDNDNDNNDNDNDDDNYQSNYNSNYQTNDDVNDTTEIPDFCECKQK